MEAEPGLAQTGESSSLTDIHEIQCLCLPVQLFVVSADDREEALLLMEVVP